MQVRGIKNPVVCDCEAKMLNTGCKNIKRSLGVALIFLLAVLTSTTNGNLLNNPSFESGTSFPDDWNTYGSGSFVWQTGGAHTGSKCMKLGGSSLALMYQRAPADTGTTYTVSAWSKLDSGAGGATLKLEFHDATETEIVQYWLPFTTPAEWAEFAVTRTALPDTAYVTASIVGEAGGTVLFDDIAIYSDGIFSADVTQDHNMDANDLLVIVQNWLDNTCIPYDWCNRADISRSGRVDLTDFARTARDWLKRLPEVLGVTHVDGQYYFGTEDFLNEGADRLLSLGTRVIKVWFTNLSSVYPWNSAWPAMSTMADRAQAPYFQELFAKPFKTFILEAHSDVSYFNDGMTEQEKLDEQQAFYDLSVYLLNTYRNTGKTFVLQHWEGDWLIRGHYNANIDPTPTAIQGMIDWLNARQAGVNQARQEYGQEGVRVYHAAEVNIVVKSMSEGKPNLVNSVLPYTNLDLVSYSSWDSTLGYIGQPSVFRDALDFIADNMPDSPDFGDRNVYLGEYGMPHNEYSAGQIRQLLSDTTHTALSWGCPYVVYWQLYCNEIASGGGPAPVSENWEVRGFWLIKPDGTYAWTWDYFDMLLNP